jgi:hypothetical protein
MYNQPTTEAVFVTPSKCRCCCDCKCKCCCPHKCPSPAVIPWMLEPTWTTLPFIQPNILPFIQPNIGDFRNGTAISNTISH